MGFTPERELPGTILTAPGAETDVEKIVKQICNTVGGCTFLVCIAWVITAIWGH